VRIRLLLSVAGVALVAHTASAQSVDPALAAAIDARAKASDSRDVAGVDRYTAADYTAVNPRGVIVNKAQRLEGMKAPPQNPAAAPPPAPRNEAVHVYGDAAVVRAKLEGSRQLQLWVKNASGWQTVTVHVVPDLPFDSPTAPGRPNAPQPSAFTAPQGLAGDRAAVFAVQKQIHDAFFAGDEAAYARHTAPEFARLAQGGYLRSGAERGATSVFNGPRQQPKVDDVTVQAWGSVAMVRWRESGIGRPMWLTRIFAKKGQAWQQVATASSLAGAAAGTQ
jgi:hypothetical protein